MLPDRSAQPSAFGWEFQVVAAISLAINNIEETKFINIEGPLQDIEITLSDDNMLYGQAKAYTDIDVEETNDTGWGEKLSSATVGLFEDFLKRKENSKFKYLVNFSFPLGKNKGGKANFRNGDYGDILGTELTGKQQKIIHDILKKSDSKKICTLSDKKFEYEFEQFLNQFSIRTCRYINLKGERSFAKLDELIKDFLDTNNLNVSVKKIRQHWFDKGFENASHKFALTKTEFLFVIVLVDNTLSRNDLFGRRISSQEISRLYDRFVDAIESTIILEDFNRLLTADVLLYFKLNDIDEYYYDDIKAEEFVNEYLDKYQQYFEIGTLSKKEQRKLTQFALARCLEERDMMTKILSEGEIKNAN